MTPASKISQTFAPSHVLACALLACGLSAQNATLAIEGGSLGASMNYRIANAGANKAFLLLFSLQRGSFALSNIDAGDTRRLGVGLDLPQLTTLGALDGNGESSFAIPLPNQSSLIGVSLLNQVLSLPGTTRSFDQLTNVAIVPIAAAKSWDNPAPKMTAARGFHTLIPLANGYQLIVGGGQGSIFAPAPRSSTEVWDAQNKSFTAGPMLNAPRALHTQTRLNDGRYLLTGGVDATNTPQNACEIFDPATGKFTATTSMSAVRCAHTATLMGDGRVLVTGGIVSLADVTTAVTTSLRTTEIYDPATGQWSNGPNMARPLAAHAAIRLDNTRTLICGGITWRSIFFFRIPSIAANCQIYDRSTNAFVTVSSMPSTRCLTSLERLADGRIVAVGGLSGDIVSGGTPSASCARFDPATNAWTAIAPLAAARAATGTAQLVDGRIVAIGGASGSLFAPGPMDTCEAYDPATNMWSALPNMSTTRLTAGVTRLPSGAIFVCGGGSGSAATATDTQELYLR